MTLAAAAGLLIAIVLISFGWRERSRQSWLRENLPEIERLLDAEQPVEAWLLARRARELAPEDSQLQQTWANLTYPATFTSEPPGAELAIRTYKNPQADWQVLGTTPFAADLPYPLMRFRVRAAGYETFEGAPEFDGPELHFKLAKTGSVPKGMVAVEGSRVRYRGHSVEIPDFAIDRLEVTNRDFARFLKEGGYRRPELWKFPFEDSGRTLTFDEAMAKLVDLTGRPGPAGWSLGAFPEGQDEHPVEGISWYEATAYAEFAGKSLPTVFHWKKAAMNEGLFSDILALSNFAGQGTKKVGSLGGIGPWGTYDMAGNVKEWCWNAALGQRYVLGASYLDASYLFVDPDARPPFERGPGLGMRLMTQNEPMTETVLAEVPPREVTPAVPADDPTFAIYSRLFDYDPAQLEAQIEAVDDTHGVWRKETISVVSGSGKERLTLHLFLPKNARPPYQAMIFFPGADAVLLHSSRQLWMRMAEFWVRGGRALVYPIYQGTYERRFKAQGPNDYRDLVIQRTKEVKRSVDYLLSREDIEAQKIGFYGLSMGANLAPHALATDPRLRFGVVFAAGLENWKMPPEVQTETFLPRVHQPFLFVAGRQDFIFPMATSQQPFFERLGSEDKKMILFEGGHLPIEFNQVIRDILGWADEKMGPVRQQ